MNPYVKIKLSRYTIFMFRYSAACFSNAASAISNPKKPL